MLFTRQCLWDLFIGKQGSDQIHRVNFFYKLFLRMARSQKKIIGILSNSRQWVAENLDWDD